jgi:hypothetical protein
MLYISRIGCDPSMVPPPEVERCPHCSHILRVRNKSILRAVVSNDRARITRSLTPAPLTGTVRDFDLGQALQTPLATP